MDIEESLFERKRILRQPIQQLKVLQVLNDGFIVTSPNHAKELVIFIHKTNEKNIVDGVFLDAQNGWSLYKYVGPYRYQSLNGPKTVHSFRKLSSEVSTSVEGLKIYDPLKEFYIANELWSYLP